ncbi:MAG: iron-sulfur cluster biosynthesis protein [Gaiellaceae bacterium]
MLALTQNAVDAIHAIKASSDEVPDEAGLRISAEAKEAEETSLHLAIVPAPAESDVVVEAEGEQIFLEPEVAGFLDDKVLDAQMDEGRVNFAIAPQSAGEDNRPAF